MAALVGRTFEVIEEFIAKEGYAPSYRQIAEIADISVSTVHCHVKVLEAAGCIETAGGKAHTMKVVKPWTRR